MLVGPYNDAVLGPLQHGHLKNEKDADVSLGIQELVSYFADLERKGIRVTGGVTGGASDEVQFIKTMGLSQDFKEFMAKKKREGDEGGAAASSGSATSKKHLRTEDPECLTPRAKKERTGETYVTVSLKLKKSWVI